MVCQQNKFFSQQKTAHAISTSSNVSESAKRHSMKMKLQRKEKSKKRPFNMIEQVFPMKSLTPNMTFDEYIIYKCNEYFATIRSNLPEERSDSFVGDFFMKDEVQSKFLHPVQASDVLIVKKNGIKVYRIRGFKRRNVEKYFICNHFLHS